MARTALLSMIFTVMLLLSISSFMIQGAEGVIDIPTSPDWTSNDSRVTLSMAFGDIDGDGDLDLFSGNDGVNVLYTNQGGSLGTNPSWLSADENYTIEAAFGDIDLDGDLDLVTANGADGCALYENTGGTLENWASWRLRLRDDVTSIALGDVDGDRYLDLAVGVLGNKNILIKNDNGDLVKQPEWRSQEDFETQSIVWGDVDLDGDLDLAFGGDNSPIVLYTNDNGVLDDNASWQTSTSIFATKLIWGDISNDGAPDLAVARWVWPSMALQNTGGVLEESPYWNSVEWSITYGAALGDMDGEFGLDMINANSVFSPSYIHVNNGTTLETSQSWEYSDTNIRTTALGDIDNDGDLDLAFGTGESVEGPNIAFINPGTPTIASTSLLPNDPSYIDISPLSEKYNLSVKIEFTLIDDESDPCWISPEYSTDGGSTWLVPTEVPSGESLVGLESSPNGIPHVFHWDTIADAVESDDVHFRIKVYSNPQQAGIIRYAFKEDTIGPFKVDTIAPKAPFDLMVFGETETTFNLSWSTYLEPDIAGFDLYLSHPADTTLDGFFLINSGINGSPVEIINLKENSSYELCLVAYDDFPNFSPPSEIVTGTTLLGNHPPLAAYSMYDVILQEDIPQYSPMGLNELFKDPDGDHLDVSYDEPDNFVLTLFLNGSIMITPKANWFGEEEVVLEANDSEFKVNMTMRVTVLSVNDPPILNGTGDKTVFEHQWLNLTLTATDPADPWDVLTFATDVESVFGDLPSDEFIFDTISGDFALKTDLLMVGDTVISINVSDGNGGIDQDNFTLTVLPVNDPPVPVLTSPTDSNYKNTIPIFFNGTGSYDPEGDPFTFEWHLLPGGIISSQSSFNMLLVPGQYSVTLHVDDGSGIDVSSAPVGFRVMNYTDTDGDTIIDSEDPDDDNDGIPDIEDPNPLVPDLNPEEDDDGDNDDDDSGRTDGKDDDNEDSASDIFGDALKDFKYWFALAVIIIVLIMVFLLYTRLFRVGSRRRREGRGSRSRSGRRSGVAKSRVSRGDRYGDGFETRGDWIDDDGYDDDYGTDDYYGDEDYDDDYGPDDHYGDEDYDDDYGPDDPYGDEDYDDDYGPDDDYGDEDYDDDYGADDDYDDDYGGGGGYY